jgi:hypothetical protein
MFWFFSISTEINVIAKRRRVIDLEQASPKLAHIDELELVIPGKFTFNSVSTAASEVLEIC